MATYPLALRTAVQQANQGPFGTTWSIASLVEHEGLSIEHYRLGGGPQLLLLPDESTEATTVQVWLPFGWGHEAPGQAGAARRWSTGWQGLRQSGPTLDWQGSARDLSGAVWTVGAESAPALLQDVMSHWPTATSTPTLSPSHALHHRMRRAFWDAVRGPSPGQGVSSPYQQADRAIWVVAGKFDRLQMLSTARQTLARQVQAPAKRSPGRAPGAGPRVPLEVAAPQALVPTTLVAWTWPRPTPQLLASVRGLAQLLGGGPESRLKALAQDSVLRGATINVAAGREGASLEAYLLLSPSVSATVAASRLKAVLRDIGSGKTTGLEFETLQYRLTSTNLRTWARLEERAQRAAEALLLHDDLSALQADWSAQQELAEPAIRALAQGMASTHPVVVKARAL